MIEHKIYDVFQVFGGDSSLMQVTSKDMYVDSSRAVDITQSDMKKSIQLKSKEAKKFAKVSNNCQSYKT